MKKLVNFYKLQLNQTVTFPVQEAATGGVLQEKVFLEISQNSQEKTCARFSFLTKLQVSGQQLY